MNRATFAIVFIVLFAGGYIGSLFTLWTTVGCDGIVHDGKFRPSHPGAAYIYRAELRLQRVCTDMRDVGLRASECFNWRDAAPLANGTSTSPAAEYIDVTSMEAGFFTSFLLVAVSCGVLGLSIATMIYAINDDEKGATLSRIVGLVVLLTIGAGILAFFVVIGVAGTHNNGLDCLAAVRAQYGNGTFYSGNEWGGVGRIGVGVYLLFISMVFGLLAAIIAIVFAPAELRVGGDLQTLV